MSPVALDARTSFCIKSAGQSAQAVPLPIPLVLTGPTLTSSGTPFPALATAVATSAAVAPRGRPVNLSLLLPDGCQTLAPVLSL